MVNPGIKLGKNIKTIKKSIKLVKLKVKKLIGIKKTIFKRGRRKKLTKKRTNATIINIFGSFETETAGIAFNITRRVATMIRNDLSAPFIQIIILAQ